MEGLWSFSLAVILSAHLHRVHGQVKVEQSPPMVKISEGENATFTCSISVSSLYWYRQRPGEKPIMLLFVYGSQEKKGGKHFTGQHSSQKKEGYLHITDARLEHEANYYCAEDAL